MESNLRFVGRKRWTAAQRERLLARYHQSELSQAQFAARHGIGYSTLARWLSEERANPSPPVEFAEVQLPAAAPWAIEIVSPHGWVVRTRHLPEVAALTPVLQALPC